MSYVLNRIKSTIRHLLSTRGMLLVLASVAALVASLTSGTISRAGAVLGAGSAGLLLLLMSVRISSQHAELSRLKRQVKKLERSKPKQQAAAIPTKSVDRVGPNRTTAREQRLAQARTSILAVRGEAAAQATAPMVESPLSESPLEDASPTVTVVVPCYNESRFLGATLESVRRQSFTDWECIVVDDASNDTSVNEARRYTKSDDRFRLIRHKVNGGLSAARNTGLRLARGRYVTFLDSDDLLMSDSLLDRLEAIAAGPANAAGSFCGMRLVPEDTTLDSLPPSENWPDPWFVDFVTANGECPFNAHAPLLGTEVVRSVGGFDESMRDGAEDWNLWMRILRRGYVFIPSQLRTAVYRQKHQSMAKDGAELHVREAQRQISLAFTADPAAASTPGAPHPFPEPLPVYQEQLIHAKRAVQYAATAVARGDDASAAAILTEGGISVDDWMDRHFSFEETINAGFRRALGLTTREVNELAAELEPLNTKVRALIAESRGNEPMHSEAKPRDWKTLFVPQNSAQARVMLGIAAELPIADIAFLNTDHVSGAQGAAPLVAMSDFASFTVNEWVLGDYHHSNLVVSFPRDGAVEELIGATISAGGSVVEVAMAGDDVMRVDDSPDYGWVLDRLSPPETARWLSTASREPIVGIRRSRGAMLWHDVTDPDPDAVFTMDEYPDTQFDGAAMERFRDIHKGERCVIIGNGPSLNQLDLRKLRDEYTIGVNGIFYAADQMGYDLSYYVVEDTMVMRDNVDEIKAYSAGHKFFPSIYRDQVGEAPNVTYFMMNRGYYAPGSPSFCVPRFSTDASQRCYSGQSVTIINLQLAYHMGFSEVVLIGMDFSYTVPPDSQIDGAHITSMGDDPNHFHPDYFGKGKVWKDPKLDRVLANYQLAKLMYEADGRRIVNATAGGRLELFDRVPYEELFG